MSLQPHGQLCDTEEAIGAQCCCVSCLTRLCLTRLTSATAFLFHDSEDDPWLQYGESWLEEPSLLSALSTDGSHLACARGARLWLAALDGATAGCRCTLPERVSALCWAACARSGGSGDDSALLVATCDGRLRVLTAGGEELLAQRLHDSPPVSVSARCSGAGARCGGDAAEEALCVAFGDHLCRLSALELASLLRRHALQRRKAHAGQEEGLPWTPEPLTVVKWCALCAPFQKRDAGQTQLLTAALRPGTCVEPGRAASRTRRCAALRQLACTTRWLAPALSGTPPPTVCSPPAMRQPLASGRDRRRRRACWPQPPR